MTDLHSLRTMAERTSAAHDATDRAYRTVCNVRGCETASRCLWQERKRLASALASLREQIAAAEAERAAADRVRDASVAAALASLTQEH